jgi:hypothetical protein
LILAKQGASPRSNLPSGFKDYQANGFAIACPSAWGVGKSKAGSSLYMVPEGGAVPGKDGGVELIAGAMLDYYVPQNGAAKLDTGTKEFLDGLQKGDTNLRHGQSEHATLGGQPALMTKMTTKTSSQQAPDQVVYLYTVAQEAGLWYVALAAPSAQAGEFEPLAKQIVGTVQFPK